MRDGQEEAGRSITSRPAGAVGRQGRVLNMAPGQAAVPRHAPAVCGSPGSPPLAPPIPQN